MPNETEKRDKDFKECLFTKMETPDTDRTCEFKYSLPREYKQKYDCKKKLGIPKDAGFCREELRQNATLGSTTTLGKCLIDHKILKSYHECEYYFWTDEDKANLNDTIDLKFECMSQLNLPGKTGTFSAQYCQDEFEFKKLTALSKNIKVTKENIDKKYQCLDIIGIPKGEKYCRELSEIGYLTSPMAKQHCLETEIETNSSICLNTFDA